ncbi:hypothetical protein NDU88_004961 [Pleurodeles waltl]|uniref:Uncharacterized protein n=1 Tax=Pleurodeles waltl TaxID=8319 RepID=A0AAV7QHG8_PLEWA|nr:hypothetical protein NDU88_004961 [Pleurodeles waltl]
MASLPGGGELPQRRVPSSVSPQAAARPRPNSSEGIPTGARAYLTHGARVAGRLPLAGGVVVEPGGLGFTVLVSSAPLLRVGGSVPAPASTEPHVAAPSAAVAPASQSSVPGPVGRRSPSEGIPTGAVRFSPRSAPT